MSAYFFFYPLKQHKLDLGFYKLYVLYLIANKAIKWIKMFQLIVYKFNGLKYVTFSLTVIELETRSVI